MRISELHQLFLKSTGICTDTRKLKKKQIFFALKGDNFDGNKYAEQAISNGALYAIIDDTHIENSKYIKVTNTLKCLQDLANFHRKHLNIPIIALTGSNGKTTTKELINTVLSKKFNVTATIGNLNNHIGVPLTLLSMHQDTKIGVVEMGANHLKEIELLCKIAEPNFGYITNIGKAHLEGFGSVENILIAKTELFDFIKKNNGTVFCNAEDEKLMAKSIDIDRILFSKNNEGDYAIQSVENKNFVSVNFKNTIINSNLIGDYNFSNIAASIAIGSHFKVPELDIKEAIEAYTPQINRSQLIEKENNSIILDAYNANPTSMKAALDNFTKTENNKPKVAILGDMFELGNYAEEEHQNIIDSLINTNEIETIFLVGENFWKAKSNFPKITFFKTTELLISELEENKLTNMHFLIKGSRGMALERTVEYL